MIRPIRWAISHAVPAAIMACVIGLIAFVAGGSAGASPQGIRADDASTTVAPTSTTTTTLPPVNSVAGAQGTDTQLAPTSSALTVTGHGSFSKLKITVNQTKNLVNQAVSVTWSGGVPTDSTRSGFSGQFYDDYLQIMECWSSPTPTNVPNPGPSPQQCEFGGQPESAPGTAPAEQGGAAWEANSRTLNSSYPVGQATAPQGSYVDTSGFWWMPFDSVDGTVVKASADLAAQGVGSGSSGNGQQFWLNPYFAFDTTNEDDFAETHSDGTGSEIFTVDTGLEAPGLGCGQQSEAVGKSFEAPQCWIVVVPRGTPAQENQTGDTGDAVNPSPLGPTAWANRITIPIEFNPIGTSCPIGGNETRFEGGEMSLAAVSNWQPQLCSVKNLPPFNYATISEDQARQQLSAGLTPMAVVTQPVTPSSVNSSDPLTYAPLTLSGAVVGFNIERNPTANAVGTAEGALQGVRVEHIYLTPRLMAKLLTESYQDEFLDLHGYNEVYGASYPPFGYSWLQANPQGLLDDPDFLQYNPEFNYLQGAPQGLDGGLVVEEPDSDAAYEIWQWILADPAASAWLAGKPDPWGMTVNPYYATNANVNDTGVPFGSPVPYSYPKSDPYCFQSSINVVAGGQLARPLCMQDLMPYASSMQAAASEARFANDGAKTFFQGGDNADSAYGSAGPQGTGHNFILSITDAASATQYGLQTASLSAAGDDGSKPSFVAPTPAALETAESAMKPGAVSGVLQTDLSDKGVYPLAMLSYAVASPAVMTAAQRGYFSQFLKYASGPGQVTGSAFGDLPFGYAPLNTTLEKQTAAAASVVAAYTPPTTPSTTSAPTTTTPPTTAPYEGASSGTTPPTSPETTVPAKTTVATTAPPVAAAAVEQAASYTPGTSAGGGAILIPVALGLGILSAFGARWTQLWRRKRST